MIKTMMMVCIMGCAGLVLAQEGAASKSYVLVKDQAKDPFLTEVSTFLSTNSILYLATVENNTPCVRPVRFSCLIDNKLAIATSLKKDMSSQMAENPAVELCTTAGDGKTYIRFSGKAALCKDEAILKKFNELHPKFSGMFKADFALYLVTPDQVGLWGGKEPKTKTFEVK